MLTTTRCVPSRELQTGGVKTRKIGEYTANQVHLAQGVKKLINYCQVVRAAVGGMNIFDSDNRRRSS